SRRLCFSTDNMPLKPMFQASFHKSRLSVSSKSRFVIFNRYMVAPGVVRLRGHSLGYPTRQHLDSERNKHTSAERMGTSSRPLPTDRISSVTISLLAL